MADECDTKVETYTPTLQPGKWSSENFEAGSSYYKGEAIRAFIKELIGQATSVCDGTCEGGNETCLPKSIVMTIPPGKGRFRLAFLEGEEGVPEAIYYLRIKEACKVTITVKCKCTPFPA
jgi:hypothetical protein